MSENLRTLCNQNMESRGWNKNPELVKRLNEELADIEARDESDFFLQCRERKEIYENEHNLLTPYLIGICDSVNLNEPSACDYGEFPDIDVDYIPKVRDELKEVFAPNQYGRERVCNIATYNKFGIRSSLIDNARVLGLDRRDILNLTTNLAVKDDEGETLSWEKAIELYPDLKKYLDEHPELAKAASRMLNRVRSIGVHASGLIISGVTIDEFVPLVKPKQDGQVASAWVEGLSGSDLGAVGLVKFDFLGLDALQKIGETCHLRHKTYQKLISRTNVNKKILESFPEKISALPGGDHFSDDSFLNDPKSLKMASLGNLKMVFQFDGSPGIRQLARQANVDRFEDLMALTSLYRPGPMSSNFHESYCRRKTNKEKYEIHPVLQSITGKTFGLLIYQEQIMQVLNKVGKIPLKDCEAIRKAISKKKVDKFIKYKEMFKKNGQEILGYSEEQIEELWKSIEAWSGYGFNRSHAACYSVVSAQELYLKTHYPENYLPGYLNNFNPNSPDDYQKMKEYLIDGDRNGIPCERVHFNLSKAKFEFNDGTMYYPFEKLKGLGEEVAARIEQAQPFVDYQDFLERFGVDAKANQALVAIGAFPGDRKTNWKYYLAFRTWHDRQVETKKRMLAQNQKFLDEVEKLTGIRPTMNLSRETLEDLHARYPEGDMLYKRIRKFTKQVIRVVNNQEARLSEPKPILKDFCPNDEEIEKPMGELLSLPQSFADREYYGFPWIHPVEEALGKANSSRNTFEDLDINPNLVGAVEVIILDIEKKISKRKTNFYSVKAEDATGKQKYITVWDSDFTRFEGEIIKGNILIMKLKKPDPGSIYRTLTIAPHTGKNRWTPPPKAMDFRVSVLKWRE